MDEVGLRSRAGHRAGELSGGEQQRVALARALVGRPRVLLADEPTGNLDYRTGEMIMAMLEDLHRTHGLTSIYVTHNLKFAERGDRILKLEKGRLEMSTSPGDPASNKQVEPLMAQASVAQTSVCDPGQPLDGGASAADSITNPESAGFSGGKQEGQYYV